MPGDVQQQTKHRQRCDEATVTPPPPQCNRGDTGDGSADVDEHPNGGSGINARHPSRHPCGDHQAAAFDPVAPAAAEPLALGEAMPSARSDHAIRARLRDSSM